MKLFDVDSRMDVRTSWQLRRKFQPADALNEQICLFLLQPNIPRQESALSWRRDNTAMFPDIAAVAQRYLSAPATITY